MVTLALLFPVLIFIATATRLAAARREQRFAAMRLVGATPRQISVVAAAEGCIAAAVGVVGGIGLFFLGRPALAAVPFSGKPFFPADLSLQWSQIALVAVGVPVAAALAAGLALRRVRISPLGVSRRAAPPPPSAWRLATLGAGVALFVAGLLATTHKSIGSPAYPGLLIVMIGIVIAGPWLTVASAPPATMMSQSPYSISRCDSPIE